jgi:hypothetical protein
MRLCQIEERVHLLPGTEKWITPAGDVPVCGRLGQNWVVLVLFPGNSAIGRVGKALALGTLEVGLVPGSRETRYGGVEG